MQQPFETYVMNYEALEELSAYWLKMLGLNHWEIALRICKPNEFTEQSEGKLGECLISRPKAFAWISILAPQYFDGKGFGYDMEVVLVHEILHLHSLMFTMDSELTECEYDMLDRMVDHVARALVELRRKGEVSFDGVL